MDALTIISNEVAGWSDISRVSAENKTLFVNKLYIAITNADDLAPAIRLRHLGRECFLVGTNRTVRKGQEVEHTATIIYTDTKTPSVVPFTELT